MTEPSGSSCFDHLEIISVEQFVSHSVTIGSVLEVPQRFPGSQADNS